MNFRPPEKPAKKCGSTKPVVIRLSASTHSLQSHTGTSALAPSRPIHVSDAASRAVVVDGPDALDEIVSEHLPKLFVGIS
jgi:hypothetical protein